MSQALSPQQVAHIAHLARLDLSPEEIEGARAQLSLVLEYFDGLSAIDTSSVPATLGVQPHSNIFREDSVLASLPVSEALQNAPRAELDSFRIPRILDEE